VDRKGKVAAAILAGGKGTRLGNLDKGALLVGGRTILDRQLEVLRGRFSRILLVLAPAASPDAAAPPSARADLVIVRDRAPAGSGPLAGLDAALAALTPDEESVVCIAGDMPLLSTPALDLLRDTEPAAQALVPLVAGHPEPLFARYHRSCTPAVSAALAEGRLKTMGLLASVHVHWLSEATLRQVDPTLASLHNINTPEDLARAEQLLAQKN
jgi:molybdopterin-guanine dinucleotide biosynthesis protein A